MLIATSWYSATNIRPVVKGLAFFGSWDEAGLINDPAVSARIAKLLITNKLRLLHWVGRSVSINEPVVVE
jgi:hypothetical protein